jgi:hypothetical protein
LSVYITHKAYAVFKKKKTSKLRMHGLCSTIDTQKLNKKTRPDDLCGIIEHKVSMSDSR